MYDPASSQNTPSSNRPRDLMRTSNALVPGAKVQPQAKELEEVVLGAMMMEKAAVNAVIDVLQPESFYVEAHGEVFRAIQALFNKSEPIPQSSPSEKGLACPGVRPPQNLQQNHCRHHASIDEHREHTKSKKKMNAVYEMLL